MTSSRNLFALKISRLIASAGSLALSILPCSIGSRGARLNGFQASCAQAELARTEPSTPAHIQRAGETTRRAPGPDHDGRARRPCRNILLAGASGGQLTWERTCVAIMFSRIHLRRRVGAAMNRKQSAFRIHRMLRTRCAPDYVISNPNLSFGYSERRNNDRLFPNISDCDVACTCQIFGRRIRRLAHLHHPLLGGAPRSVLGPGCAKTRGFVVWRGADTMAQS
jgi:hypothetical protein